MVIRMPSTLGRRGSRYDAEAAGDLGRGRADAVPQRLAGAADGLLVAPAEEDRQPGREAASAATVSRTAGMSSEAGTPITRAAGAWLLAVTTQVSAGRSLPT